LDQSNWVLSLIFPASAKTYLKGDPELAGDQHRASGASRHQFSDMRAVSALKGIQLHYIFYTHLYPPERAGSLAHPDAGFYRQRSSYEPARKLSHSLR
jgi:hypothetical protein